MINQEKTIDRVNHDLLYKIQQKLSFCCNFIYWIGIILTDIKSQIKVNGFLMDKTRVENSDNGIELSFIPLKSTNFSLFLHIVEFFTFSSENFCGLGPLDPLRPLPCTQLCAWHDGSHF